MRSRSRAAATFHLVTQVWGDDYTRLLTDYCIPALLAPGNLPALVREWPAQFIIYTRERDRTAIERSACFAALSALLPVTFVNVEHLLGDEKYSTMTVIHREVLRAAGEADAAIVWLMPDTVWSDGSLETVARLARTGVRAVMQCGIRVRKRTILPILDGEFADGVLAIAPRALVRLGVEHMHAFNQAWFWDAEVFNRNAANVYWRAGRDALVARCYHLHPLMLHPTTGVRDFVSTFDDDLLLLALPDFRDIHVVSDSDAVFHIDLAEDDWAIRVMPMHGGASAGALSRWAWRAANVHHRRLALVPIDVHSGPLTWRSALARARSAIPVHVARARLAMRAGWARVCEAAWGFDTRAAVRAAIETRLGPQMLPPAGARWRATITASERMLGRAFARALERVRVHAFTTALARHFGMNVAERALGTGVVRGPRSAQRRRHCTRRLGLRLKEGFRAPLLPDRVFWYLLAASLLGNPRATRSILRKSARITRRRMARRIRNDVRERRRSLVKSVLGTGRLLSVVSGEARRAGKQAKRASKVFAKRMRKLPARHRRWLAGRSRGAVRRLWLRLTAGEGTRPRADRHR